MYAFLPISKCSEGWEFSFGFVRVNQSATQDCFHKLCGEEHMLVINDQLERTSVVIIPTTTPLLRAKLCRL